jgi:hypothetical protein
MSDASPKDRWPSAKQTIGEPQSNLGFREILDIPDEYQEYLRANRRFELTITRAQEHATTSTTKDYSDLAKRIVASLTMVPEWLVQ